MRRKIIWIGLSILLVAAMVISSCSKTTTTSTAPPSSTTTKTQQTSTTTLPPTSKTTTTATSTAAGGPTYGGSMTLFTFWGMEDPSGFDAMTRRIWSGSVWINPFTEWLCRGDIEKYGPRGDNEYSFQTFEYVPEQFLTGELAESWELTENPLKFTFQIRKGVMFTGNQHIGMAPREVQAADIVFSLKHTLAQDWGPGGYLAQIVKDATATGTYTVEVLCTNYDANWFFLLGGGMAMGAIQPKEMADADTPNEDWHNAVGSGPFILKDYVSGSGATYTANPNYWGTTTINGKEYKLPFIQTLYYTIMPDESVQISALRTGKLDWYPTVKYQYQQTLASSAPNMIQVKYLIGKVWQWRINRLGSKYLNTKEVRQALMVGLDLQAISDLLYGGGPINSWPLGPQVPGYTETKDLPAADQALFSHDVTKAKQMLTDAGYPNGFTIEIDTDAPDVDLANACASYWTEIGVKTNIKVLDATTLAGLRDTVSYPDMLSSNYSVVNPLVSLQCVDATKLASNYALSEPFTARFQALAKETDPVKRTALIKSLAVDYLDDVNYISFGQPYTLNCYWPWLKNYYGELDSGYYNQMAMIKRIWIDQNLKKSLGKG